MYSVSSLLLSLACLGFATTFASLPSEPEGYEEARAKAKRDEGHQRYPAAGIERINRCGTSLYYFSVWRGHTPSAAEPAIELAPQTVHFDRYHLAEDGHGVSEKYADQPFGELHGSVSVLQFEYTTQPGALGDRIDTDWSLIDCGAHGARKLADCPVRDGGFMHRFGKEGCPSAYCEPTSDRKAPCGASYIFDNDDHKAMRTCRYDGNEFFNTYNTTLIFCPNEEDLNTIGESLRHN